MGARKWLESAVRIGTLWIPWVGTAVDEGLKRWEERRRARTARATLLDVEDRRWRPDSSPAALLRADFGVVPFQRQRQELENLSEWCEGTGDARKLPSGEIPPVALRLYTAPAGYGKTRLLLHFARRRRELGWEAGFLGPGKLAEAGGCEGVSGGAAALLGEQTKSLLLVFDHAESRREELEAVITAARKSRRERVRLVLLARSDGDWWQQLHLAGDGVGDFFQGSAVEGPLPLAPLTDSLETRQEVFEEAAAAFAEQLGKPAPDARMTMDGEDFDRVLMIHAAALAAVEGETVPRGGLLNWLLSREERGLDRVREKHSGLGNALQPAIAQAAALLTLAQGADSHDETMEILGRVPDLGDQPREQLKQVAEALHVLYRGCRWCDGVEPDLVGDRLVRRELEAAPALLAAAFGPEVPEARQENGLLVLNRLAQRQPETRPLLRQALQDSLPWLALPAVNTAIAFGDPIGQVLAEWLEENEEVEIVAQFEADLPFPTIALRETGAIVDRLRLERHRRQIGEQPSEDELWELSRLANNLSLRLNDLGRSEDAITASQEAVDIRRWLAKQRPDAFLPYLATSLNNLSADLGDLGRSEDAITANQEAVDIQLQLAEQRPEEILPDLADNLVQLSKRLAHVGRPEDALTASQEAVDSYRRLAEHPSGAFLPHLANSLNELSIRFADLGEREHALTASQEAVDTYRRLAKQRPEAFLPDLAASLNNLSGDLAHLGLYEGGLAASQEAVEIQRRLAEQRPDAFLHNLADSLNNLSNRYRNLERHEDGLAAIQKAVDSYRRLAEQSPEAYLPNLATSLTNLSGLLAQMGRLEEGLNASREAVGIYRRLAKQRPMVFLPDLAGSLTNLSVALGLLGQPKDGSTTIQEAVDIYRRFAEHRPTAHLSGLVTSLGAKGQLLSQDGKPAAALAAIREALDHLEPFFSRHPPAFAPLMTAIIQDYEASAEACGESPDRPRLEAIREILGQASEGE